LVKSAAAGSEMEKLRFDRAASMPGQGLLFLSVFGIDALMMSVLKGIAYGC
jgi:hypothetical protein